MKGIELFVVGLVLSGLALGLNTEATKGDNIHIPDIALMDKHDIVDWAKYNKLTNKELDDSIKHRGLHIKHDPQLEELIKEYPVKIKKMEQAYLEVKYKPLPTPEQIIQMNNEIERLRIENEEKEALREKEVLKGEDTDEFLVNELLGIIDRNNEIIDDFYITLELEETKKYYTDKIERLKDKYAMTLSEINTREKGLFERDPLGTTYYIDYVNGDDANNGTNTESAWKTLHKYTTDTSRTDGDIAYVRANQNHIYAKDIVFDEDASASNYHYVIGCDSITDPFGDGSDVKTNISFGGGSYQMNLANDDHWEFRNLIFRNSADTNGIFYNSYSYNTVLKNCTFRDGVSTSVEGLYVNYMPTYLYDCEFYNITTKAIYNGYAYLHISGGVISPGTIGATYGLQNRGISMMKNVNITNTDYDIALHYGPVFGVNLNIGGTGISASVTGLAKIEDEDFVKGTNKAYFPVGLVESDDSNVRSGGADSSAKMQPTSKCGTNTLLTISGGMPTGDFRIWTPASATTVTIYIKGYSWASFPTVDELFIETSYLNDATTSSRTTTKSTQVLVDNDNWVAFTNTFTPSQEGWAYVTVNLGKYVSGDGVYVDIAPVVS